MFLVGGEHRHHRLLAELLGVKGLAVGDIDKGDGAVADAAGHGPGSIRRDGHVMGLLAGGNGGDHLLGGGVDDADGVGADVADQGAFPVAAYGDVVRPLAGFDGGDHLARRDADDDDVAGFHVGDPHLVGPGAGRRADGRDQENARS